MLASRSATLSAPSDVLPLYRRQPRPIRRPRAVLRLPGAQIPEVRRQPPRALRLPAGVVQRRRRTVDLDPRRLGRRNADGPGACRRPEAALSEAPALRLDDDHRGPAGRVARNGRGRRGVLLSARSAAHRQPDAAPGEAPPVCRDGDRDLAEPAAGLPSRRREDGDGERPDLEPVVPSVPDGQAALPAGPGRRRPVLHAVARVGRPGHRPRRGPGPRHRDRQPEVRLAQGVRRAGPWPRHAARPPVLPLLRESAGRPRRIDDARRGSHGAEGLRARAGR